ncbi:MAG: VCBS repeat-containing protein, partial [Flavobacteriaceae bacterium]|nr:VCBS repeat-containing protein [Flavobacteriaceae bacterium]
MKKNTLLILSLFTFSLCSAQIDFTLADPQPNLIEVYGGSFASGDIDNDGDQDLLMTGLGPGSGTALYLNDGNGDFTEVTNTPFPIARFSVTEFVDLDADGDLDLFFSGIASGGVQEFTHIYLNDGTGSFTQLSNPLLPQFQGSGAAIADVDGDEDLDILISAEDGNSQFVADIYLNDGNANFTPSGNTAFTPVKFASVAFIDVENDGD